MGHDSLPIVNQDCQNESTLLDEENTSMASSRIDSLGRTRCRRSSVRMRNNFDLDAKKDSLDQKPAALPKSTSNRNGTKSSVSSTRNYLFSISGNCFITVRYQLLYNWVFLHPCLNYPPRF